MLLSGQLGFPLDHRCLFPLLWNASIAKRAIAAVEEEVVDDDGAEYGVKVHQILS